MRTLNRSEISHVSGGKFPVPGVVVPVVVAFGVGYAIGTAIRGVLLK